MPSRNQISAMGLEAYRAGSATKVGQLFSRFIDLAVEEEDELAVGEDELAVEEDELAVEEEDRIGVFHSFSW